MSKHKFRIAIKWNKNDRGLDVRTICIYHENESDKKEQINKIVKEIKTKPMDIGINKGKIPFLVSLNIPNFSKSKLI